MADDHVVFVARARRRRRSMNSGGHHHNRLGCRHLVMTNTLLRRVHARTTQLAVVAAPAAEGVDEALPELGTHETVGDWVAARRDERQQVDVVHGGWRDVRDGVFVVEDAPRLHDVHRRPANEEQDDDDCQHLYTASLGPNATGTS